MSCASEDELLLAEDEEVEIAIRSGAAAEDEEVDQLAKEGRVSSRRSVELADSA